MKTRDELEKLARKTYGRMPTGIPESLESSAIRLITEALIKVQDEALKARLPSEEEWMCELDKELATYHPREVVTCENLWRIARYYMINNMKPADKEAGEK